MIINKPSVRSKNIKNFDIPVINQKKNKNKQHKSVQTGLYYTDTVYITPIHAQVWPYQWKWRHQGWAHSNAGQNIPSFDQSSGLHQANENSTETVCNNIQQENLYIVNICKKIIMTAYLTDMYHNNLINNINSSHHECTT